MVDGMMAGVLPARGGPRASIELEAASFGWRGRAAVRNVTGRFSPGAMTAIVGPNGAGKSTLMKGMMGLLRPGSGRVHVRDADRGALAWLPQAGDLDRSFPMSVYDLVAMGAWRRTGPWSRLSAAEHARTERVLAVVRMSDAADRAVGTLSGGQLQRVLFARMLMQDADMVLLDEPFAAVDRHTTEELMALLCDGHTQGQGVIAVLHDLELVREYFPRTLLLAGDVIAWGPTAEVLTPENLRRARDRHEAAR
ncbi:metal ABC transporter ATP-binding protein [Achromobacter sp. KS-M25]|nr:metal ABC transporter ATP-binding protein [Achromobacter aestuarii]